MIRRYKEFYIALVISVALVLIGFVALVFKDAFSAVVFLVISVVIILLFSIITYKRIKEIRLLSEYLSRINDGEFDLDIQDNKEGELSILKNNIYKVVVKLRSQSELLLKDKTYLADSLADISHQLKTPITSMTMMTDLLKQETDEDKKKEFIEVIESQLLRMNWLMVTLLKISKIDAGSVEFKKEKTKIKTVIDKSLKQFLVNAEVRNIEIETNCSDDVFAVIDENWFVEAISNIIKNCLEHTDNGGKLVVTANNTAIYTKIIIKDNGYGIDKEDLPHIFERFYQGKNHSESSIGIGLALSKAIFNRSSATVNVKSELNVGTEFEIKIYKTII